VRLLNFVNKHEASLFIILILLGFFLRVWNLNKAPTELFGDEIDAGIQAYSILKTGKDYFSNSYPVIFHSFSEYRLPVQIYSMVPTIWFFGLNEFGVRMANVIFATLSMAGIFLLTKELINKKVAFIALLFLIISPWHLQFSRQANDAGFVLPFIIFGTLFFLRGLTNFKSLFISAVIFSLSIYAYATASLFTPLYVLTLIIVNKNKLLSYGLKRLLILGAVVLLILAPYIKATFSGSTTNRFNYVSVFNNPQIEKESAEKIQLSDSPLTRIFYSKKSLVTLAILKNYIHAFSTDYLFLSGDADLRNSVGIMGELYYFDLIFILVGSFVILAGYLNFKNKNLLFIWLLVAPVASSLTVDGATHAGRLLPMLVPLLIFSAAGFVQIIKFAFKNKVWITIPAISLLMAINVLYYFHRYYVVWPKESWRFWQSGFKETLKFVKDKDSGYQAVYFNNTYEPMLPRFLFWYKYDPQLLQAQFTDDKQIDKIVPGFDGFKLGEKYYFGQLEKPVENNLDDKSIYVASARDDITNPEILNGSQFNLLKTVYSPTNMPIFYVFTKAENKVQ